HPKLLRWLYILPLLPWTGFLPLTLASRPKGVLRIALTLLWAAGLLIAAYLVREWRRMRSATGVTNHPLLGFVVCFCLPSATVLSLMALLSGTAGKILVSLY